MKKLLSLLSVLTISGTAVSTTIAASPYRKEEHSTENLVRNKRQSTIMINFNPTQVNFETNHDEIIKLMQLLGIVVGNTSFTFYEYTDLNITKHTNIKKWSDLVILHSFK